MYNIPNLPNILKTVFLAAMLPTVFIVHVFMVDMHAFEAVAIRWAVDSAQSLYEIVFP